MVAARGSARLRRACTALAVGACVSALALSTPARAAQPTKVGGSSPRPDTAGPAKEEHRDRERISKQAREEARARAKRQRSKARRGKARESEAIDASRLPGYGHPSVQRVPPRNMGPLLGWSGALDDPRFSDRRRRVPPAELPTAFGGTLHGGERFVFDVYFAGNPAGLAEAWVASVEADPRGNPPHGSPRIRLDGKATTSGVVSVLASVTDHMYSIVDGNTGAAIKNVNVVTRSGLMAEYKRRETSIDFEGRGHIRVVDDKDGKIRKVTKHVPTDTLDPLGAMAWVRSLDLQDGERAVAHAMDGKVLLRVEVVGRGPAKLDPMPSIASGLGIGPGGISMIEGSAIRVDRYDVPVPGKRPYTFRAWLTNDGRGLLLALESDMWLGVIRLVLSRYDPPRTDAPPADPAPES